MFEVNFEVQPKQDLVANFELTFSPAKVSDLENDIGYITLNDIPQIPTNLSELNNDIGFITLSDIPEIPKDVSSFNNDIGYITLSEIPEIPTSLSELDNDVGYITLSDIPEIPKDVSSFNNDVGYITLSDIPQIPTKLSELNNDTGFITFNSIPKDISNFNNDMGYITLNDIPEIPTKLSELNNDTGFITLSDIPEIPTNLSSFSNDVGYITLNEIPEIPTKLSELNNDTGFITAEEIPDVPENVVTRDELDAYQIKITAQNKIDSDLVDDTSSTNKFVTDSEKNIWNNKQNTISDLTTIRNNASKGATAIQPENLSQVAMTGSYNDLSNKPIIPTKYGYSISVSVNPTTFVGTVTLKDQNGDTLGEVQTFDLPLESVVVGGSYDETSKSVVLTLKDGSNVSFSVADLVRGLQVEITDTNKLSADLIDDTNSINKFVSETEKETWNNKQDIISDLTTIRTNANKGATAVQPDDITVSDVQIYNTSILEDGVATIPIGDGNNLGVVKPNTVYGIGSYGEPNGYIYTVKASNSELDTKTNNYHVLVPSNLDYAVKAGITNNSNTLTDEEKTSACSWIGASTQDDITVTDVQINGTSIVEDKKANIPIATSSNFGVVKHQATYGIGVTSTNVLRIVQAISTSIDGKSNQYTPITPNNLDYAVKTSITTNTIALTEEEQTTARTWLGVSVINIIDED